MMVSPTNEYGRLIAAFRAGLTQPLPASDADIERGLANAGLLPAARPVEGPTDDEITVTLNRSDAKALTDDYYDGDPERRNARREAIERTLLAIDKVLEAAPSVPVEEADDAVREQVARAIHSVIGKPRGWSFGRAYGFRGEMEKAADAALAVVHAAGSSVEGATLPTRDEDALPLMEGSTVPSRDEIVDAILADRRHQTDDTRRSVEPAADRIMALLRSRLGVTG